MNVRLPIWLLSGAPAAAPSPTRLHYPVAHWIAGLGTPRRPSVLQTPFPVAQWIVCGGGLAGPVPPGPIYQTFLGAVRGALLGDAGLAGVLRGGVWHRYAPRGVPEPLLVFITPTANQSNSTTSGDYMDVGQIQLSVYGPDDGVAFLAANRAVSVLTDAALAWTTGRTFYLRPSNVASPLIPQLGYGGARVFGEVRVLDFKNYGNYAVG